MLNHQLLSKKEGFKSKTVDIKERKIAYKMEQNAIIFK